MWSSSNGISARVRISICWPASLRRMCRRWSNPVRWQPWAWRSGRRFSEPAKVFWETVDAIRRTIGVRWRSLLCVITLCPLWWTQHLSVLLVAERKLLGRKRRRELIRLVQGIDHWEMNLSRASVNYEAAILLFFMYLLYLYHKIIGER